MRGRGRRGRKGEGKGKSSGHEGKENESVGKTTIRVKGEERGFIRYIGKVRVIG